MYADDPSGDDGGGGVRVHSNGTSNKTNIMRMRDAKETSAIREH